MLSPRYLQVPLFLAALLLTAGCAGVERQSPSEEVKAFFVAANEANFLGVTCDSAKQLDLSGYSHLLGVKYPPTKSVDVLNSPPARPYQAFAVLETTAPYSSETFDAGLLESLKSKAMAIGADAIYFCRASDQPLPGLQKSARTTAVAVKYRLGSSPGQTRRP